jgi:uncharacterized protein YcfJ
MSGSPNFRLALFVLAAICALGVTTAARAEEAFFYAEVMVTHVEPLTHRVPTRVTSTRCDSAPPASTGLESEYADLAAAIDGESRHLARPRCRELFEIVHREEITGYRVAYRYDGSEYVRILSYDPGETLRVKIQVRPQIR